MLTHSERCPILYPDLTLPVELIHFWIHQQLQITSSSCSRTFAGCTEQMCHKDNSSPYIRFSSSLAHLVEELHTDFFFHYHLKTLSLSQPCLEDRGRLNSVFLPHRLCCIVCVLVLYCRPQQLGPPTHMSLTAWPYSGANRSCVACSKFTAWLYGL